MGEPSAKALKVAEAIREQCFVGNLCTAEALARIIEREYAPLVKAVEGLKPSWTTCVGWNTDPGPQVYYCICKELLDAVEEALT